MKVAVLPVMCPRAVWWRCRVIEDLDVFGQEELGFLASVEDSRYRAEPTGSQRRAQEADAGVADSADTPPRCTNTGYLL